MTSLKFAPELSYFTYRALIDKIPLERTEVWDYLNSTKLFNMKVIGDILLNI